MSELRQSRHFGEVQATSAFALKATSSNFDMSQNGCRAAETAGRTALPRQGKCDRINL